MISNRLCVAFWSLNWLGRPYNNCYQRQEPGSRYFIFGQKWVSKNLRNTPCIVDLRYVKNTHTAVIGVSQNTSKNTKFDRLPGRTDFMSQLWDSCQRALEDRPGEPSRLRLPFHNAASLDFVLLENAATSLLHAPSSRESKLSQLPFRRCRR